MDMTSDLTDSINGAGSNHEAQHVGLQQIYDTNSEFGIGGKETTMMQPTLMPSIPYSAHLALTVTCTVIFCLIFLFVYAQLWMVLYYKHKKRSYQTIFLFLCLIWAALRVTLFSFYFKSSTTILANNFNPVFYWLLYSCPVVLQFTTLVLLVLFFSQVVVKAKYPLSFRKYRFRIRLISTISLIVFIVVNVVCGVIAQHYLLEDPCNISISFRAVAVRVGINGSLFLLYGIALSYSIFLLNKVANARALLESRGTNLCQSWTTCVFIVFIFASRAVYNVVALVLQTLPDFGYGSINVTDQADLVDLTKGYSYALYLGVLFLWEILPTLTVTIFFRVQKPSNIPEASFDDVSYRQQYFFDNPRRYDSDEDLSIKYGSNSFTGSNQHNVRAINSNSGAGNNTPVRAVPSRYDPHLATSSSRPYREPEYNGT